MLRRKDIHGHYVHTLVKWVMESDCIAAYAKAHPQPASSTSPKEGSASPASPTNPS